MTVSFFSDTSANSIVNAAATAVAARDEAASYANSASNILNSVNSSLATAQAAATAAGAYSDAAAASAVDADASATEIRQAIAGLDDTKDQIAALVRQQLKLPVVYTGSAASRDLLATDLGSLLVRDNTNHTTLVLKANWQTDTASCAWAEFINATTGNVTVQGDSSTVTTPVTYLQTWTGSDFSTSDTVGARNVTVNITVPAGTNRKLALVMQEVNADNTAASNPRTLSCTVDGNAATKVVNELGANGYMSVTPKVNAAGFRYTLADSASAATNHTIVFNLPAKCVSFCYRIYAVKDCSAVNGLTGQYDAAATTHSYTLTGVANGYAAICFTNAGGTTNGLSNTKPTGWTYEPIFRASNRTLRDFYSGGLHGSTPTATSYTGSMTFDAAQEDAIVAFTFSPVGTTTNSVTLLGNGVSSNALTVPAGRRVSILSWHPTTYHVSLI